MVKEVATKMGIIGLPGTAPGAAAKEGISAFTRVAAREWGIHKINLNTICPFALTPAYDEFKKKWPGEMEKQIAAVPLGRIGDPEKDIGPAAVFLASAGSDYMTGQTRNVEAVP